MSEEHLPYSLTVDILDEDNLGHRERMFLEAYFGAMRGNIVASAKFAGYRGDNANLYTTGAKILKDERILPIIRRWAKKFITPKRVIEIWAQHAQGSVEDFVSFDPKKVNTPTQGAYIDLIKAQKRGSLNLVKKLKITPEGVEVELYSSQAALEQLGKHMGLFVKENQFSTQLEFLIRVLPEEFRDRVRAAIGGMGQEDNDTNLPIIFGNNNKNGDDEDDE